MKSQSLKGQRNPKLMGVMKMEPRKEIEKGKEVCLLNPFKSGNVICFSLIFLLLLVSQESDDSDVDEKQSRREKEKHSIEKLSELQREKVC